MTGRFRLPTAVLTALAALACGCVDQDKIDTAAQRDKALADVRRLQKQLDELQARLGERDRRVRDLLKLGEKRLEKLYTVRRIRFGSGTGGIDLDDKAGDDAVKVVLQPIDQHGSVIKAAGNVTLQIFDLAAPAKQNLLGEFRFDVDETAKHWSSGFISYHYSFTCRFKAGPPKHDRLTVRAAFVEYLTGKRFETQQVCTVRLPAKAGG